MSLTSNEKKILLELAKDVVFRGLKENKRPNINAENYSGALAEKKASFVTIYNNEKLCGCIGSIEPARSLVADVAHNSYSAAFNDFRFKAVTLEDFENLSFHISVLSTLEKINFKSEPELFNKIQTGIDGIIIEAENRKATFLPSVWESLSDKKQFFDELKKKAGLSQNFPAEKLKVFRYSVETIS